MKELKQVCNTDKCMLCKLCLKDWLPAVQAHRKNFRLRKGEVLFREGDEMNGVYFIYSGTMKVHKQWGDHKELIVRFAKDGQIVGHRGLGKDNFYPVSATAIEPTIVCCFGLDFFKTSLKVNQDFLYELMMFFASELKESEKNMRNLAHMQVKGRIAYALFALQEKFGTDEDGFINIRLSRQDIASFAGTTYETLFRVMNELIEEGAITIDDKRIKITASQILDSNIKTS